MATFFSNTTLWYWGSTAYPVNGTLTGNVSRSGNTVTLSGLTLSLSWPAGAWGSYPVSISVNGTGNSTTLAAGTGSWGLNNTSFGVSDTQTSASIGWSTSDGYSGSFTVTFPSGATGPSGASMSWVSHTWNSVTIKGKVTNWGSGYSNPSRHFGVGGSTITSTSGGRREENVDGSATTDATVTINNSDIALDGGINIRGCLAYRVYMWYGTSVGSDAVSDGWTTRYTPPAPLQSLNVTSQLYINDNQTSVAFSTTGGNSTNNNNVNVTTQYRYTTNGGTNWSSWTAIGSATTPWTEKTWTLTFAPGTNVTVQTRQVYQNQASETKSLSFKVYQAPTSPSITFVSSTPTTVTMRGALSTYGNPLNTSATNQGIAIALIESNEGSPIALSDYNYRWDWAVHNNSALSGNATVGDSNDTASGLTELTPNTYYYPYIHGYNGTWVIQNNTRNAWFAGVSAVCTAPNPVVVTLMDISEDLLTATETATMHFTQQDINLSTGSSLTPQYRYSVDGGTTYSAWIDLDTDEPDGDFDITGLPFETEITVQTRTLYFIDQYIYGQTVTFTTDQNPHVITGFSWTFDELRRTQVTWNVTINGSFTKTVTLTIKGHTVTLINNSTDTTGSATESLPSVYVPNETLQYTITVLSANNEVIETKTASMTMPRPIIGLTIDPEGTKRYITDIVKYGGSDNTGELKYDDTYTRFKVV